MRWILVITMFVLQQFAIAQLSVDVHLRDENGVMLAEADIILYDILTNEVIEEVFLKRKGVFTIPKGKLVYARFESGSVVKGVIFDTRSFNNISRFMMDITFYEVKREYVAGYVGYTGSRRGFQKSSIPETKEIQQFIKGINRGTVSF